MDPCVVTVNPDIQAKHKSKGALIAAIVAGVFAAFVSTIIAVLIKRQHAKYQSILSSRKRLCKFSHLISFTFTLYEYVSFDSFLQN